MAVFKAPAELLDAAGEVIGAGTAYVHLPRGVGREQRGSGTISLKSWLPGERPPSRLRLGDGRELPLEVSSEAISDCSRNRILRYETHWVPAGR